jgi:hypothetical protein
MFPPCAQQVLLATCLVSYSVAPFGNNKQTVLKRRDNHIPLVLDFMKNRDFLWNTEFEHCRKKTSREMHYRKLYRSLIVRNSQYMT